MRNKTGIANGGESRCALFSLSGHDLRERAHFQTMSEREKKRKTASENLASLWKIESIKRERERERGIQMYVAMRTARGLAKELTGSRERKRIKKRRNEEKARGRGEREEAGKRLTKEVNVDKKREEVQRRWTRTGRCIDDGEGERSGNQRAIGSHWYRHRPIAVSSTSFVFTSLKTILGHVYQLVPLYTKSRVTQTLYKIKNIKICIETSSLNSQKFDLDLKGNNSKFLRMPILVEVSKFPQIFVANNKVGSLFLLHAVTSRFLTQN